MNKQKKNATIFLTLFILSSIFVFIPIQTNAGNSIIFGNLPECFTSDKTCTVCEAIGMAVGIAKFILKFVGVLALLLFVWGGFSLIISSGKQDAIDKSKKILTGALIGLIIVFGAWQMVQITVATLISRKTTGGTTIFEKNWSNICPNTSTSGTQDTKKAPLNSIERGQPCHPLHGSDTKCKSGMLCRKAVGGNSTICAFDKTIEHWQPCYPLHGSATECKSGMLCRKVRGGFICAFNKTIENGDSCYPLAGTTATECQNGTCNATTNKCQ